MITQGTVPIVYNYSNSLTNVLYQLSNYGTPTALNDLTAYLNLYQQHKITNLSITFDPVIKNVNYVSNLANTLGSQYPGDFGSIRTARPRLPLDSSQLDISEMSLEQFSGIEGYRRHSAHKKFTLRWKNPNRCVQTFNLQNPVNSTIPSTITEYETRPYGWRDNGQQYTQGSYANIAQYPACGWYMVFIDPTEPVSTQQVQQWNLYINYKVAFRSPRTSAAGLNTIVGQN